MGIKKARLEQLYRNQLKSELQKELGLKNIMQVPKITKIVVNTGVKEAVSDGKILASVKDIVEQITGQAAIRTIAKKSIAGFKLREGMAIGVKVTLRGRAMYEFLDRLINAALPRIRDFQGVGAKFDKSGNYNLGIRDWMIFPEVNYDKVDKARGLNITIGMTALNVDHSRALLRSFNMPFRKY